MTNGFGLRSLFGRRAEASCGAFASRAFNRSCSLFRAEPAPLRSGRCGSGPGRRPGGAGATGGGTVRGGGTVVSGQPDEMTIKTWEVLMVTYEEFVVLAALNLWVDEGLPDSYVVKFAASTSEGDPRGAVAVEQCQKTFDDIVQK